MPFRFSRILNYFAAKIASQKFKIFRRKLYPSQAFPAEASLAPPEREEPPLSSRILLADGRTVYRGRSASLAEIAALEALPRAGGNDSESDDEEHQWKSKLNKE
ncbi:hypothetical protein RUND412_004694 [Rhizina undulata]